MSTEQETLARLALNNTTWSVHAAGQVVYKWAATAALRRGTLQRYFRDLHAGTQHVEDIQERAGDIAALVEFRTVIDSAAARFAAERRDDTHLAAMENAQAELEAAETLHESRIADTAFHLAVAHASGNHELAVAVEDARVKMFAPVDLLGFQFLKKSCVEGHALVLAAVRDRDPDRAAAEMTRHLTATGKEFELLLAERL